MNNRIYKFRAWDKTNQVMLVDKDLWIHIYPQKDIKETSVANLPDYHIGEQPNDISYDPRTDLEVMQFTGLKDKNGKEIYEGDIVRCGEFGTYEIKFHQGAFMPLNKYNKGMGQIVEWRDEVLGNVYEHPQLIPSLE